MTINVIQDPLGNISIEETSIPTYTVSTSPWITSGTSSVNWNPNTFNTTTDVFTISPGLPGNNSGKLKLEGKEADIDINGVSLMATLKRIEERINLLTVNTELEAEWDELRELGKQYRELEQRIKDKMETWRRLNAQDRDNR